MWTSFSRSRALGWVLCTGAVLACDDGGSDGLARSDTSVDAGPVADARPTEPDTEPADAAGSSDMAAIEPLVATAPAQVEVDEDGEVRFTLDGSGGRGALTVDVFGLPGSGTLEPAFGPPPLEVVYRPMPDFAGDDTIEFTVNDLTSQTSSPLRVPIRVRPVNDAPVAVDDEAEVDEDTAVEIDLLLNDRDPEDEALSLASVGEPSRGVVELLDGGRVRYTPGADVSGLTDTFRYTVADAAGATAEAQVTILVRGQPDAPTMTDPGALETDEDTPLAVRLEANDPDSDGGELTVEVRVPPALGVLDTLRGPSPFTPVYTPNPNVFGDDTFEVVVVDPSGLESAPLRIALTVRPVNDPPTATDDEVIALEDQAVQMDLLANDSDVDGEGLLLLGFTQPARGRVELGFNGLPVYTPAPGFEGRGERFEYTVADPSGAMDTAEVRVNVFSANDPPEALDPGDLETDEDTELELTLEASDPDPQEMMLGLRIVQPPENGTLDRENGVSPAVFTYTPNPDFHGTDRFLFEAVDSNLATSPPQEVVVVVRPVNDAPVGSDDAASTGSLRPVRIPVLANDLDIDSFSLAVETVDDPPTGDARLEADGTVLYTPRHPFEGVVEFTYRVRDDAGARDPRPVRVSVTVVSDPAIEFVSFDAEPRVVVQGNPVRVSWSVLRAEACQVEGARFPLIEDGGAEADGVELRLDETETLTLVCTGPGGRVSRALEVTVLPDADGDGIPDAVEVAAGYDPFDTDSDGDNIPDGVEDTNRDGEFTADETDALDQDTDDDGLVDAFEDLNRDGVVDSDETDPRLPDTDGDGRCDYVRFDDDGDGIDPPSDCVDLVPAVAILEFGGQPPFVIGPDGRAFLVWRTLSAERCELGASSDDPTFPREVSTQLDVFPVDLDVTTTYTLTCEGPGAPAVAEVTIAVDVDTDRDGFADGLERLYGYDPLRADTDEDGIDDGFEDENVDGLVGQDETDPRDADTDDDGLLDGEETWSLSLPGLTDPRVPDTDGDGLLDGAERAVDAQPTDADTDDDGLSDGVEVRQGTRPDDPDTDGDGRCDGERIDNEGNGELEPAALCVGTELQSGLYFVDADALDSDPSVVGLSWQTAYRAVQGALDAAAPGDTIWIARGTYRIQEARAPVARPRPGQKLLGGFEGDERTIEERPLPAVGTVFNGDRLADGRTVDDSERLIIAANGIQLDGLQLVNGYRTARDGEGGAGLWLEDVDDVRVVDVSFSVGFAHFGAAVGCVASSARFERVEFRRNIAAGAGGAVHGLAGCALSLTDVRFDQNDAVLDGGAIALEAASTVDVLRADFSAGKADFNGGAIALADESVAVIDEARFARNQAEFSGGAVFVDSESSLTVSRSRFFANRCEDSGGALGAQDLGTVNVDTSVFSSNRAGAQGGAVWLFDFAEAQFTGVLFTGNSALAEGGAVAAVENVVVRLDDAQLDQNRGDRGGALYVESDAVLRMRNGLLTRNEATEGGALVVSLAEVELSHVSARANTADVGGAAFVEEGKLALHNSVFFGNSGRDEGDDLAGDDLSDVEATGHCGADDLDQPDLGWVSQDAVVVEDDPFQELTSGQVLLAAGTPCRGVADPDVANEVFTGLGREWTLGSATTDGAPDGADGLADPGWHAAPGSVLIKRYVLALNDDVEFSVDSPGVCALLDGEERTVLTLDDATVAAGITRLERPARSRLTLECLGAVGVARATALVP